MSIERKNLATQTYSVAASADAEAVEYNYHLASTYEEAESLCEDGQAGVLRHFNQDRRVKLNAAQRKAMKDAPASEHARIAQQVADTWMSGGKSGSPAVTVIDLSTRTAAERKKLLAAEEVLAATGVILTGKED